MTLGEKLQIGLSIITLIGVLFAIYKYFRTPDEQANEDIKLLKQGCELKHTHIDEKFGQFSSEITAIKENHLAHIEKDIAGLHEKQVEILTILRERLPKK